MAARWRTWSFDGGERGAGATPGGEVRIAWGRWSARPGCGTAEAMALEAAIAEALEPLPAETSPKSGLNFRFTDEDLSTAGSWFQKATQRRSCRVLRQLEKDGRQATPDEQRTLAWFIGWGASDIANGLFSPERTKLAKVFEEYQMPATRSHRAGGPEGVRPPDRDYWTVYPKAAAAAGGASGYGQPIPASVVTPESFGLEVGGRALAGPARACAPC